MLQDQWNIIRGAIGAILIELDKPDEVTLPEPIPRPLNTRELALYMLGVNFEIEIGNTLNFTFDALKNTADDLTKAHRLAAAAVVPNPSDVAMAQMEDDLRTVHRSIQADQRFHAGIALAGAVADIATQLNAPPGKPG